MPIEPLTDANRDAALALLRARRPSSLFLLGNLADQGPRLTEHLNSGDFQVIRRPDGAVGGVFALFRRGNLILQTDRRGDDTAAILDACDATGLPLEGILGDHDLVAPLVAALRTRRPGWTVSNFAREPLFDLDLTAHAAAPVPAGLSPRRLAPADFDAWRALMRASNAESNLPEQGTPAQIREAFEGRVARGVHWGAELGGRLVAIAVLNIVIEGLGLVGGVYTAPEHRRRGFSRAVMDRLAADARTDLGLDRLVLFTGEDNVAAQTLYRGMGFTGIGTYAMVFGKDA